LGYRSIRLQDLRDALTARRKLPTRPVVFTFDDGYAGVYESALELLRRAGYTATVFLIAEDYVGDGPSRVRRAFPIMTREQLNGMVAAGFEIGSHSLSHPRLTDLPEMEARREIQESKHVLEETFGKPIHAFCYPYGYYDSRLAHDVEEAGYTCAATTRYGRRHAASDLYKLKRIPVGSAQGFVQFAYRLLFEREMQI
jgi:peptidoglycan/xylan/chitin deacetylase (PgdA/CDA1 family)